MCDGHPNDCPEGLDESETFCRGLPDLSYPHHDITSTPYVPTLLNKQLRLRIQITIMYILADSFKGFNITVMKLQSISMRHLSVGLKI